MKVSPAERPETKRLPRTKKVELTRQRLLDASIRVVGTAGYAGATVRKITLQAGVAHGTFYNYFRTDQDLFDQILPYLGQQLFDHLDNRLPRSGNFLKSQELILIAFDEFIRDTPSFYRVMTEAEAFAPRAFRTYISNMVEWLNDKLCADESAQFLQNMDRQKLEAILLMVVASNHYLNMRFGEWMEDLPKVPTWAVETFGQFVRAGMLAAAGEPMKATPGYDITDPIQEESPNGPAGNQPYVKFTPRKSGLGEPTPHSGQSMQLGCRVRGISPGHVRVELDVDRRTLNSRGAVSGGTLSALAEVAAGIAVSHGGLAKVVGQTVNIGLTIIQAATEGKLIADARVENAGRNIRFVTVKITLDKLSGVMIASASVVMRVIE